MNILKVFILLILSIPLYSKTLFIEDKIDFNELLSFSSIYIDQTNTLDINDIKKKNIIFKENSEKILSYGYSPSFTVWIKFTINNNTNKSINKILEYNNSLTSRIEFYGKKDHSFILDGSFNVKNNRASLNPIFKINLDKNEQRTFYLKVNSKITSLIIKLNLWDYDKFYEKEIKYQLILSLFFGAMLVLALYNLFIFFFTKDISYLYYVLYILGVIIHHLMYKGFAQVYILNNAYIEYISQSAVIIVTFPILALALFIKSFLNIKQYNKLNIILNIFLFIIFISAIFFACYEEYNKYRNILPLLLILYTFILTIYSVYKKNRASYFIAFGWLLICLAILFMILSSFGLFNIYFYLPYLVEVLLLSEMVIFAIALADRINTLQKDKILAQKKLFLQEKEEKEKLRIKVDEKTYDLKNALSAKALLLKELNHRVKNNMQTIVSLIRLQSDEVEDKRIQDIFLTIQNRISAMSHLHELLYKQDNILYIDAYEYFDILIEEIKDSYHSDKIEIILNIQNKLKMQQAIYCGLILNELITNSFKYAFDNQKGTIRIKLYKIDDIYYLEVKDNGKGYIQDSKKDSLGLILVNTLTKSQLKGNIIMQTDKGVDIKISWNENA